jgi:hypothetical protein
MDRGGGRGRERGRGRGGDESEVKGQISRGIGMIESG